MEQTRLLLIKSCEDYSLALNTVLLVRMRAIPTTIDDTMFAYMVVKDWCKWIKEPKEERSAENTLFGETADYLPMLEMFEKYAEDIEDQLIAYQDAIEAYFRGLNPNLVDFWRGLCESPSLREDTRLLFRSLRYTAQLFEEKFGTTFLNKLLDEKQIPQMNELDRCLSGKTE